MGTDIHLYVEKKTKSGYWQGTMGKNPRIEDHKQYAEWAIGRGDIEKANRELKKAADIESGEYIKNITDPFDYKYYAPKVFKDWAYSGRNYDLFAILGNVRNGRGFAGVETGEGFNYISDGRGIPEDASDEVRDEFSGDWMHSESYVTLKELMEFDWGQSTVHYGVVDEEQYQEWKEKGRPSSWSGNIYGQSILQVSNSDMEDIVTGRTPREEGKSYHTRVSWEEPYHESVGSFYTHTLPDLKDLSEEDDYSDVRIIFGFDS